MNDLVKELRQVHDWRARQAADRIEMLERENNGMVIHFDRLVARNEKLTGALREIANGPICCPVSNAMRDMARKALEEKDD